MIVQKMDTRTIKNIDVIEILMRNIPKGMILSEIRERLKLSQHPAHRKVKSLTESGILKREKNLYFIDSSHPFVYPVFNFIHGLRYAYMMKNGFFKDLKEIILSSEADIAILFGSYARGEQRNGSDIDVFLADGKRIDFKKLEIIHFGEQKVSPIYATSSELCDMLKEKKKLTIDLIKEGIIIKGCGDFYNIVFKAFENEYGKI